MGKYEYKSYPADMGLPRVGARPLAESFWTRRDVCSKTFGGTMDVGELIPGDMILGFFWGGSVAVEGAVMDSFAGRD